jgi:hypothetical protein
MIKRFCNIFFREKWILNIIISLYVSSKYIEIEWCLFMLIANMFVLMIHVDTQVSNWILMQTVNMNVWKTERLLLLLLLLDKIRCEYSMASTVLVIIFTTQVVWSKKKNNNHWHTCISRCICWPSVEYDKDVVIFSCDKKKKVWMSSKIVY